MQIEYCGRIYDEKTDFIALLRAATRNEFIDGMPDDLAYWSGLGALHGMLTGTPVGVRMAEAALTLMETGTPDEFCMVQAFSYEDESGIPTRMLALIENHAGRIPRAKRGIGSFLLHLMSALPTNPESIAFLRRECGRPDADSEAPHLSARLDIDWFLGRLPELLRIDPAKNHILECLYRVPATRKQQFLDIVAASGVANVETVIQTHLRLWRGNEADLRYEAVLSEHPVFAAALARARRQ